LSPVEKPAPPRPRRFERLISARVALESPRASVARSASPGASAEPSSRSPRRTLSATANSAFGDLADARSRHVRNRPAVHQDRRPLVAHPGAGGHVDRHQAVFRGATALDPELLAHQVQQRLVAEHAVGDVVREQHPVAAGGFEVQEAVEARDALEPRARQADSLRNARNHRGREPAAGGVLDVDQDLQRATRIGAVGRDDRVERAVSHRALRHLSKSSAAARR
jgi:hypothetical protein